MRGGSKDGERDDKRDDKIGDEEEKDEEEQGKNPHHTYKDLDRTIHTIFRDKVALETARAIMAVANSDEKTIDPKYQNWSHRAITFSRADQWAKISKPGRFPLVLDLVIKNIRFEKVLIDDGSALDILFRNALTELGLKPEDLKPYDTPFWGCSQGRPLIP
jgi:hypothetical protein